jgi:cholest-4-en-3-one 26-monooxygenase
MALSRDTESFSSERGGLFIEPDEVLPLDIMRLMFIFMDPPKHTRYRRIVSRGFTPRAVAALEDMIRRIATQQIDAVCAEGRSDLVPDLAWELPLQVINEMIGVPPSDRAQVTAWLEAIVESQDPESRPNDDAGMDAFIDAYTYLVEELAPAKIDNPQDDLASVLLQADVNGERLSDSDFATTVVFLAGAGTETVRSSLSGGALALMENPEERAKLAQDPSLLRTGVEEIMRWVTPITYFRRTATRDLELHGRSIKEDDAVVLWYMSANFDEDVHRDPLTFDVTRPGEHVSFGGGGPHFCLGAALARLELRVVFEELLRRMPDMQLAGEVERVRSNWMRGLRSLPVSFTPSAPLGARS